MLDSIKKVNNDSLRLTINKEVSRIIEILLTPSFSFADTLKSINKIGKVFSPDKKFSIISWNAPLIDGKNIFFGYIQLNPGKDSVCKYFKLNDISSSLTDVSVYGEFSADKWPGALYYEIVAERINNKKVYILLGSRLNNLITNKKIIETFYFDNNDLPAFGLPIIDYQSRIQKRIIFEYAIEINMTLHYNEKLKMIVFDHLSPSSLIHKGDYKFYGPDFSYDGLKFIKDRWTYVPDIKIY